MGWNIDSVDTPVLNAWMKAGDVVKLYKKLEDELAEGNFLEEMLGEAETACADGDKDRQIKLPNFWWYGGYSGTSHKTLIKKIAPKVMGEVEAIFYWEGGESISGLAIKDGKVAECEVEQRLVKPEGW